MQQDLKYRVTLEPSGSQETQPDEVLSAKVPWRKRRRWTRWLPSWKVVVALGVLGLLSVSGTLCAFYATVRIPPEDQDAIAQAAIFTYADGEVLARLGTPNRQNVKLEQVPESVRYAVLAAEDHNFYTNGGVEPKSIARALLSNIRGGSEGGSTISQQYVKNVFNQRERTFKRKFDEVFLAVKINRKIDKDSILERYLNTIYLGRGAFGMQAAAQAYFRHDVGQLTASEGAFLAGIINAPALADPLAGAAQRARAERRWQVVLDAMVKEGWLDATTRAGLKFPKVKPVRDGVLKGQTGYLVSMAQAEVERKLGLSEEQIRRGGFKIVTTFDKAAIEAGVAAVKRELPKDKPKHLQIGLTAIDPKTGAVRAIYGGNDFLKRQQNSATQDRTEVAGTFSTFALLAAFKEGLSPVDVYDGGTPRKIGGQEVHNYRAKQYGYVTLLRATEQSVNTAFAQLNERIGGRRTRAAAYAAGIPQSDAVDAGVTNVLGTASLRPIDLARSYATLAAGGIRRTPFVVQSVTRIDSGKVALNMGSSLTKGKRAFATADVVNTSFALQRAVTAGTGSYATRLRRPVAGQTGTSASSRSAWFVGYTPQLATAVSMYELSPNGKDVVRMTGFGEFSSIFGGGYPTRIWTNFMTVALAGQPVRDFPVPENSRIVAQPGFPQAGKLDKRLGEKPAPDSVGVDESVEDLIRQKREADAVQEKRGLPETTR